MHDVAPHDRFFKSTLGRPDRLGKVLKAFLPGDISASFDPGSLVPLATESVGEGLDSSLMDLAFSARFGDQEARIQSDRGAQKLPRSPYPFSDRPLSLRTVGPGSE